MKWPLSATELVLHALELIKARATLLVIETLLLPKEVNYLLPLLCHLTDLLGIEHGLPFG